MRVFEGFQHIITPRLRKVHQEYPITSVIYQTSRLWYLKREQNV